MRLNETVEMMNSEDYQERFKAEYMQLTIRMGGLKAMLDKYHRGVLPFKPKCSYELLNAQLKAMEVYVYFLEERAEIEGIELIK